MEKLKHTEGEWKYEECRDSSKFNSMLIIHNGDEIFAYVEDYNTPHNEERKEANAKLIAAAPEMMIACKAMDELFSNEENTDIANTNETRKVFELVRNAIQKATK